jgi:hypothetical protein
MMWSKKSAKRVKKKQKKELSSGLRKELWTQTNYRCKDPNIDTKSTSKKANMLRKG